MLAVTPAPAHAAAPVIVAKPDSGPVGSKFLATVTFSPGPCTSGIIAFFPLPHWEWGTWLGPVIKVTDCTVSELLTVPASWPGTGVHAFYGIYQNATTSRPIAIGTFNVTAAAASATPTAPRTTTHPPSPKASAVVVVSSPAGTEGKPPTVSPPAPVQEEQSAVPAILATDSKSGAPFPYVTMAIAATSIALLVAGIVWLTRRGRADRRLR
jgi:hypothetical protein